MGDQETGAVRGRLGYVPAEEFERVLALWPSAARTALFATMCRLNVLYMVAAAGSGHLGSSFSSLDIVSWLHLDELGPDDVYFSSKGHDVPGLYSVLLGLGRLPFESIHKLRRQGGLPGHPDISTPGIAFNTGSLGMGISKAKGVVLGDRLAGRGRRVFVLTGDGELQEGQIWESLATAVAHGMTEITVIVDHNKLQSDTFVASVSDLGDLEAKFAAFGWDVRRCDGHHVEQLREALAGRRDRPRVVIADTIKGRGVSFMEHTRIEEGAFYQFHSGAPSVDDYARAHLELVSHADELLEQVSLPSLRIQAVEGPSPKPLAPSVQRLVSAYADALLGHAGVDETIVALDADLLVDVGLAPFRDKFPERLFECGIAEQDMVSTAGALASTGLRPVVHSFASFLSTRPNEQIYNNATERRRVLYVGSLAGVLPGGPGHSHQAVRDIASLSAIPGLELVSPMSERQVHRAMDYCVNSAEASCYLRLCSVPIDLPVEPADEPLVAGRGQVLTGLGGTVVVTVSSPVTLREAAVAVRTLEAEGISVTLIAMPFLNRLDVQWFAETISGARAVVTIDDHFVDGGQGAYIAASLADAAIPVRVTRLGVVDIPAFGTPEEVLAAHGLDATSIAEEIRRLST